MTGIRFLVLEAAFATAYEVWVGAAYWGGLAGELGVPWSQFAVVAALPWLGSLGQLFGLPFLQRVRSMKRVACGLECAARALWVIPYGFGFVWGAEALRGTRAFPVLPWFQLVGFCLFLSSLLSSAGGLAWKTWMQRLIPSAFYGRFFGLRQRMARLGLLGASLSLVVLSGIRVGELRVGPFFIGLLSLLAGALSLYVLRQVPERSRPERNLTSQAVFIPPYLGSALGEVLRNQAFVSCVVVGALYQAGVQLVMPYLGFYFTRELHLSLSALMGFSWVLSFGALGSAHFWGQRVDRVSSPQREFLRIALLMAFSSALYAVLPMSWIPRFAPLEYLWTGLLFSGFNVALMKVLFSAVSPSHSMVSLALYFGVSGVSGGVFAWLGGRFVGMGDPHQGFRTLLLVGVGIRCVAVALGARLWRSRL